MAAPYDPGIGEIDVGLRMMDISTSPSASQRSDPGNLLSFTQYYASAAERMLVPGQRGYCHYSDGGLWNIIEVLSTRTYVLDSAMKLTETMTVFRIQNQATQVTNLLVLVKQIPHPSGGYPSASSIWKLSRGSLHLEACDLIRLTRQTDRTARDLKPQYYCGSAGWQSEGEFAPAGYSITVLMKDFPGMDIAKADAQQRIGLKAALPKYLRFLASKGGLILSPNKCVVLFDPNTYECAAAWLGGWTRVIESSQLEAGADAGDVLRLDEWQRWLGIEDD